MKVNSTEIGGNNPLKRIMYAVGAAVVLLIGCLLMSIIPSFCPIQPIRENVEKSIPTLKEEGLYPCFFSFKLFQMDNYTDVIMLQESVTLDEEKPIQSAMSCTIYKSGVFMDKIEDLERYINGDLEGMEPMNYSRYWHGYLFILKPLLTVFTYQQIRIINFIVFFAVLLLVLYKIWKNIGLTESILFLMALACVALPFIPYNLQFSWTFYIAFGGILWMIHITKKDKRPDDVYQLMLSVFVLGGLTSFFDLLVTPIVTIGLPLTVWMLKRKDHSLLEKIKLIVFASVSWVIGYAWVWGSKWVIGGLITGENIIANAINQASARTTGMLWKGMELTIPNIGRFIWNILAQRGLIIPLMIALAVGVIAYILFCKNKKVFIDNLWLILIALMTPVWFIVLREHSIQHGWFTWRALSVSVYAGMLFVFRTCNYKAAKERMRLHI